MTNKEYILDCLADGGEAKTQVIEFFKFIQIEISVSEIDELIKEMLEEDLIIVDGDWVNEFGERPYTMTTKGRALWQNTVQNSDE